MWRSLPDLQHLGAARQVPAPSGQACAPAPALLLELAALSEIQAATVSARAVTPALTKYECRIGGCRSDRFSEHTGYCEAHNERYWDHVHENTQQIGRGDLP